MTKKKEQDKNNPDWWLHIHDKYDIKDLFQCEIVIKHRYEQSKEKYYQLVFQPIKDKSGNYYYDLPNIPLHNIIDAFDTSGIQHYITDQNKSKKVEIDYIAEKECPEDIVNVIGIGGLCMSSLPCCHRLVVKCRDGVQVTIRFANACIIKAIYDHTGQPQRPHIVEEVNRYLNNI